MKNFSVLMVLASILLFVSTAEARYGSQSDGIPGALIVLAIALFVFLLLREVNCWYFKINEGLACLREIKTLLENGQTPQGLSKGTLGNKKSSRPTSSIQVLKVDQVKPGTQSERLGIQVGDIISKYDGVEISSNEQLSKAMSMAKYNKKEKVEMVIVRDGKDIKLIVSLDPLGVNCSAEDI